jgi:hypothetical protein
MTSSRTQPKPAPALVDDPLWYKDAVIYEARVRSFYDSNGDGIGDFKGMTEKLDYLQELGITALWILPFYPSPLKDDGYDISGYTEVHPQLGSLAEFKVFLREAHRRGIRVITELVLTRGAPGRSAARGTTTSGATRPRSTRKPGSFSRTTRHPTGATTRSRKPTSGTASSRASPT